MPENVITNILDCLPIDDAMRTSIFSRKWRFKWTLLTHLVFDDEFSELLQGPEDESVYDERNISRLLNLKGPITKFSLYIPGYKVLDVKDISHWVMFLSSKGIKELTLENMHETPLKLPTYLFSYLEFKYLELHNCLYSPRTYFSWFLPNLLSLELYRVTFESGNCGEIITECPLLEILNISYDHLIQKMKLVVFAKLKNLKILSLPLRKLANIGTIGSIIFQLGGSLPKLEELYLDFQFSKVMGSVEKPLLETVSNAFPSLKTLTLNTINFDSGLDVLCIFGMICGSPNLQTLKIIAASTNRFTAPVLSSDVICETTGHLQLEGVMLSSCRGLENEVSLIMHILACSPLLKKDGHSSKLPSVI